jgi:hypothetical protein
MRRLRLGLLLGVLVLALAPGCRTLAGVATFVGTVAIEAALDDADDDWDDDGCEPERRDRRAASPNQRRSASRPADPGR